jgi:hypothetical protein
VRATHAACTAAGAEIDQSVNLLRCIRRGTKPNDSEARATSTRTSHTRLPRVEVLVTRRKRVRLGTHFDWWVRAVAPCLRPRRPACDLAVGLMQKFSLWL